MPLRSIDSCQLRNLQQWMSVCYNFKRKLHEWFQRLCRQHEPKSAPDAIAHSVAQHCFSVWFSIFTCVIATFWQTDRQTHICSWTLILVSELFGKWQNVFNDYRASNQCACCATLQYLSVCSTSLAFLWYVIGGLRVYCISSDRTNSFRRALPPVL